MYLVAMTVVAPDPRLPWDFHPALRPERLRLCARLLVSARRDALALAREELGDDNWSVGCRAFSFGKHRLQRVADGREHPWLRVLDGSHHFVFLIEDVPVRFYRGAADDAPERTLKRQEVEAQQLGLALGVEAAEGLVFRLAVETGPGGAAERVVFLALRGEEGLTECFWPVPLDEAEPAPGAWRGDQLALPGHNASAVNQDLPRLRASLGRQMPRGRAAPDRTAEEDAQPRQVETGRTASLDAEAGGRPDPG
ncbi:MAG TPA: hypothetical protein VEZ89_17675 [Rubrivivax sp.]|nr:hypothetical protein [Rubrivivax sp.]